MSDKKEVKVQVGPGLLGSLGILFLALKLTGFIDWSWWFVLMPFYFIPVFVIVLFVILLLAELAK